MSTPAPAVLNLPPRSLRKASRQARRESVEAPGSPGYEVDISLLLARVTIRGVAGVSSAAVAEYVAILQGDLANAARLARLNAPTLPAPACIEAAVESVLDHSDEEHNPNTCTDPCCVPEDDAQDFYCADEGHVVLSDSAGYYGVSSGGW